MYEIVGHYSNCNICGAGNDMILLWRPEDRWADEHPGMWKAGYSSNCHGRDTRYFATGKEAFDWLSERKWLLATQASKRQWREMEREYRKHPYWLVPKVEAEEVADQGDEFLEFVDNLVAAPAAEGRAHPTLHYELVPDTAVAPGTPGGARPNAPAPTVNNWVRLMGTSAYDAADAMQELRVTMRAASNSFPAVG